ncbi:MAG: DMT family transporter [Nanoarchaeota archaeon]
MRDNPLSLVYASIVIILWGTVAAVSKLMLNNISNYQLMFYVALFSTTTTFFILLLARQKNTLKEIKKNFGKLFILGILGMGIYQFFYFTAISKAPVAQVNVLNYMWPIFILIFSIFLLKDKFSRKTLIAFLLGIFGAYLVITKGTLLVFDSQYILGYVFALIAALSWALFSILNKKIKLSPIKSMFFYNLIGLLFMVAIMAITNSSFNIPFKELLGVAYIGVIPTGIGFLLWIKSLQLGKPAIISNLSHLTPFISLVFIWLIAKEQILISEIIGLIIIVSGILLQLKK